MLNIFNLFLFLFAIWIALIAFSGKISLAYFLFGALICMAIAFFSHKTKIIENKSELLYLSVGFYSHFFTLYLKNIIPAIKLIFKMAFSKEESLAEIHEAKINYENKFNPALLITTINMTAGLFCIGLRKNSFLIHSLNQDSLQKIDFSTIAHKLKEINDDHLV